MAGIEALTPPMSSDPGARVWHQVRALQLRVASLESRRNLIYRGGGSGTFVGGSASGDFVTSGRPLVILFGPNRLLMPARRSPPVESCWFDISSGTQIRTVAALTHNDIPDYANTNQEVRNIQLAPGSYDWTVTASSGITDVRYTWMVWELPTFD